FMGELGRGRGQIRAAQVAPGDIRQNTKVLHLWKRFLAIEKRLYAGTAMQFVSGGRILAIEIQKTARQRAPVRRLYIGLGQIHGAEQYGNQQNRSGPKPE